MQKTLELLHGSGLSEKEARTYLAALSLGPTTALKIARQTDLKRATVYSVVDSLVAKGLMRIDEVGFKKAFVAEDPKNLQALMERKLTQLASVLPELDALHKKHGEKRIIKTFDGLAALGSINQKIMDATRSGDFRYFIGGDRGWQDADEGFQRKYFKWRERIRLDARLLFQDSDRAKQHQSLSGPLQQQVKVLPEQMKLKADILITPHMLVLQKLSAPVSAVVIEDLDIIDSYKELFLYMWNVTPDSPAHTTEL